VTPDIVEVKGVEVKKVCGADQAGTRAPGRAAGVVCHGRGSDAPSLEESGGLVQIQGSTALVTGANRGLGLAFVEGLLARGAAKVYAAARNPASLDADRARHGERLVPVLLDVTRAEDRRAVAESCGDVELLVSNAGLAPSGPVLGTDEAVCRETFEVNVFGPLALLRELGPALRRHGGGVLFVNSVTGLIVSRSSPVYGASKAAVRMLALALRQEFHADGVVVTTSHPGFIDTDMASEVPYPKASPEEVVGRSLDAWESGATVVFPDRLAELVERALSERTADVLAEPQRVMTGLVQDLQGGSPSRPPEGPASQDRRPAERDQGPVTQDKVE
jgi:NAD(P)-dependent dehydrogenase (short-subunit alcohol dehydrogenase family)